jgi:hypothetical protein
MTLTLIYACCNIYFRCLKPWRHARFWKVIDPYSLNLAPDAHWCSAPRCGYFTPGNKPRYRRDKRTDDSRSDSPVSGNQIPRSFMLYPCHSIEWIIFHSFLSVSPHGTTQLPFGRIFMKFDISVFFENLTKKFKINSNPTRITGTLHEALCTFMTISRWILLRMINVSDKNCRASKNTHFTFNNFFRK